MNAPPRRPDEPHALDRKRREYRIGRTFSALVAAGGLVLAVLGDPVVGGSAACAGVLFALLYDYLLRRLDDDRDADDAGSGGEE